MNVEIVSSIRRKIIEIPGVVYVYIPLTEGEKKRFAPNIINPCWRIRLDV
jgi:hypothetical protein